MFLNTEHKISRSTKEAKSMEVWLSTHLKHSLQKIVVRLFVECNPMQVARTGREPRWKVREEHDAGKDTELN